MYSRTSTTNNMGPEGVHCGEMFIVVKFIKLIVMLFYFLGLHCAIK